MSVPFADAEALRAWWRCESWIDLAEDPTLAPAALDVALAEGRRLCDLKSSLDNTRDATPLLRAIMQAPWEEAYAEPLHALAREGTGTPTALSLLDAALARVVVLTRDHGLRIRARRNQGGVAYYAMNAGGIWASTRDVLRMLAEGTWERRAVVDVSVFMQQSNAFLLERNYSQALHFALQASTLAAEHEGGRFVMEAIWGHVALCAVLDDRREMAEAWLARLGRSTTEGVFLADAVQALYLDHAGRAAEARELARQTLMLWPGLVLRRKNAYLARYLVELLADGMPAAL